MPCPLPVPVRQAIWRRYQNGQDGRTIAEILGLCPRTVRQLIHRFRRKGQSGVIPSYERCGAATAKRPESVVQAAIAMRREHPSWGAGLIRVKLQRQRSDDRPPAERTLQRWFVRAGLAPAPRGRRPVSQSRRAERPHQVWQMDASEKVPLRTGQRVSWLRIVDECSGAVLWTFVFPPGRLVDVDWNPPRRPQDNGVVERSQGTAKRWAEPGACATVAELQRRMEEMDGIQRQEYPSIDGRSRLEAFPQLVHSGRAYTPGWERAHWSLAAVAAHLAKNVVPRRVDRSGMVSVYNRNHYVCIIHKGKTVHVMFDPTASEWIFADEKGQQLRTRHAPEISRKAIIGLMVTHRRKETNDQ
jgi:hypothetical protein